MELKIVTGHDLAVRFRSAGSKALAVVRQVHGQALLDLAAAMRRNVKRTFRQRTGKLADIVIEEPTESGGEIIGRAGSPLEYAEIQEEGGDIHAKNVGHLTIPLSAFETGRGVARGTARDVIGAPEAFGYDRTEFAGNLLFGVRGSGEDEEREPLFALVESVHLDPKPWAEPALKKIKPKYKKALASALEALL